MSGKFKFAIDRGGTFTDVYAEIPTGEYLVTKLLSEDPDNYEDAPREGIRRILEKVTGKAYPRDVGVDTSLIESIKMGTTVATNALLERKGSKFALVITKGYEHLLHIGNQSRPSIFAIEVKKPEVLYSHVLEVEERVILLQEEDNNEEEGQNGTKSDSLNSVSMNNKTHYDENKIVQGSTGEKLYVEQTIDEAKVSTELLTLYQNGYRSIAIVFSHAYTFDEHEKIVGNLAKKIGFTQVSLSSEVMPMVKMVPRGLTTCIDAYLTPVINNYLVSFKAGFDSNLDKNAKVSFMQSDGGLTAMDNFSGHRAILSGPAGGVVGYSRTCYDGKQPIIGFDMGGTSTDVSRYDGSYEHVFETTTAGITIQSPQLDINTVAAGGGSRLFYRNGLFIVGPESAGAHPGPVCYRKKGFLAVTDANVMLGRIIPRYFPHIFGPTEDQALDPEAVRIEFESIANEVNQKSLSRNMDGSQFKKDVDSSDNSTKTNDEIAYGFLRVATEAMCRPIRNLTTMKGFDVTTHALACFGGAGPQFCCAMAKSLGIKRILVNRFSGILSAYGIHLADIVVEKQEASALSYTEENNSIGVLNSRLLVLENEAISELLKQGFKREEISVERFMNMRFEGTDCSLMISSKEADQEEMEGETKTNYKRAFEQQYKREFGFVLQDRNLFVDDLRVRATGHGRDALRPKLAAAPQKIPNVIDHEMVYFEETGRILTPLYMATDLMAGHKIEGPAIIIQDISTCVIEPGCIAKVTEYGDYDIEVGVKTAVTLSLEQVDPIYLSIFSHRFMGIAEQMGRTLQRTSVSVNIKERLDFSCALFDATGGLVANAPHLPVHLGAMQEAVRYQILHWGKDNLFEGDVLVSNHPQLAGGSHLPDITVITPIFKNGHIVFFVASRGHHADVGGIAPGSMPPLSKLLVEEGAAIVAFKLVENGIFQEEGITKLLKNIPEDGIVNHNCIGTRNLKDNLSDLRAQVAANTQGTFLMHELMEEYSLEVVQAYMTHIQNHAENAVRSMLKRFSLSKGLPEVGQVSAIDYMDDGTQISLKITIDRTNGSAIFDFEGTGPELYGNLNAPPAVTASAVIYCLRCLIPDSDVPLNQGCLVPITINIPKGTLLNPSAEAGVVGGNVLTSQRVTDVIFRAFNAVAASQGCMNNLTFGNSTMGYYETIAGGAGAGPGWNGESGVHTHMTNTRITDPEILERRFPIILRKFHLRSNSGGMGLYRGGDGVVRELEFRIPLTVSILSERRSFAPYGLNGGVDGQRGLNLITFAQTKRTVNLGSKNTINVAPGDRLTLYTPGGGGFGSVNENYQESNTLAAKSSNTINMMDRGGGSLQNYSNNQESA